MVSISSYKRALLKFSGETLVGTQKFGFASEACNKVASSIKQTVDAGIEVGVVIGAGNIFRGAQGAAHGLERTPADHIGIFATLINGIMLHQGLENVGCKSKVMSSINCDGLIEKYNWQRAMDYLNNGFVVIFVGGTGLPFFTTDSAAALRACEIKADILLKNTKVDGVYSKDPMKYDDAIRYNELSYDEALSKHLKIMDAAALTLCRDNHIPIKVSDFFTTDIVSALTKPDCGTLIK